MADAYDGIIIGSAIAAVVTILVTKFIDRKPDGGATPRQVNTPAHAVRSGRLYVTETEPLSPSASPVVQTTPTDEAAYNVYPTEYRIAFGTRENQPGEAATFPV